MNKETRNQLRSVVVQCRTLLERSGSEVLQGEFGIHLTGLVEPAEMMSHLSLADQQYREQILTHLEHIKSFGLNPTDAVDQLVREASFTHLNRLCAYKMMEKRELIKEAVSRGLKSKGFLFYLADHPEDEKLWSAGQQDIAYRHFLESLGVTLSAEIGVLFSPQDLANRLFPPFRVLDRVLSLINTSDLESIWVEDEAIGWVYQYFTPKELRDRARTESQAPRTSYELAFRNQFYTPRYVVQFLVENTLGRTWYEMRQGKTGLMQKCRYLVRRPNEIFLSSGERAPEGQDSQQGQLSDDELLRLPVYVEHRAKKDPREIKILDPACGSGHFLLYCFDLLQTIYEEAFEDEELGAGLREQYQTTDDFRKAVPALILEHNLHGIDIDLRATQIAGLALWLRCQRVYKELGLKPVERPPIMRTNVVCAEPMPGEKELLEEFGKGVQPRLLGQLVSVVFEKMKLAGEAGSLLRIKEDLSSAIAEAKRLWRNVSTEEQMTLFQKEKVEESQQPALFDLSGITDEQFWHEAEARVIESLSTYANSVTANGQSLLRRLFANDAAQGFAYVDICRKRFDVVLMNPPFGEATVKTANWLTENYKDSNSNLFCAFVIRSTELALESGLIGCITDKSFALKETYEEFRRFLYDRQSPVYFCDLGWEVLDTASVETAAYILKPKAAINENTPKTYSANSLFFDMRDISVDEKEAQLLKSLTRLRTSGVDEYLNIVAISVFRNLPHQAMSYVLPPALRKLFTKSDFLDPSWGSARRGMSSGNTAFASRLVWEIEPQDFGSRRNWNPANVGGGQNSFYRPTFTAFYYRPDWGYLRSFPGFSLKNVDYFWRPAIGWGKRTDVLTTQLVPSGQITAEDGQVFVPERKENIWLLLGVLNSTYAQATINAICGGHKGPGYLAKIPLSLKLPNTDKIGAIAKEAYTILERQSFRDETTLKFIVPLAIEYKSTAWEKLALIIKAEETEVEKLQEQLNDMVLRSVFSTPEDREALKAIAPSRDRSHSEIDVVAFIAELISYSVGCVLGRWDVRYASGERHAPDLSDPFAALPPCAPGALTGANGLPLLKSPSGYPLRVDRDGILVDDLDYDDDIIRRVSDVFELVWEKRAEAIEREACALLGVKTLRDYFRKPSAGGFWMDHVKRYSKSRRKAPIYWLLRSSKGNYAIWLYYHRFNKDSLYKALLNYVEPKLRLEENNLSQLRQRRETVGTTGREAKQLEKELDRQESFISELHDFHDKLKRAADLHLEPDLNDGVVLNIAPLWELVPWTEAKKYWKELTEGKYEWSTIGKQLRERGLVKG